MELGTAIAQMPPECLDLFLGLKAEQGVVSPLIHGIPVQPFAEFR
jgi:hypothetical protein